MLLKKGETTFVNLKVVDTNDNRILNDMPTVTIKNELTGLYFNGITFTPSACNIYMKNNGSGMYSYPLQINECGDFEVDMVSETYNISETISVKVYSDELNTVEQPINEPYQLYFHSDTDSVLITVKDINTNLFWNGTDFVPDEISVNMNSLLNGDFIYILNSDHECELLVEFNDYNYESFILKFTVITSGDTSLKLVSSSTLKFIDNSNSIVLDQNGMAVSGVKVACYNKADLSLVAQAVTDNNGAWQITIPSGEYMFAFEKDGYSSITFESVVN